jgi:hypothetical protein
MTATRIKPTPRPLLCVARTFAEIHKPQAGGCDFIALNPAVIVPFGIFVNPEATNLQATTEALDVRRHRQFIITVNLAAKIIHSAAAITLADENQ